MHKISNRCRLHLSRQGKCYLMVACLLSACMPGSDEAAKADSKTASTEDGTTSRSGLIDNPTDSVKSVQYQNKEQSAGTAPATKSVEQADQPPKDMARSTASNPVAQQTEKPDDSYTELLRQMNRVNDLNCRLLKAVDAGDVDEIEKIQKVMEGEAEKLEALQRRTDTKSAAYQKAMSTYSGGCAK